jgi:hypothetical protein
MPHNNRNFILAYTLLVGLPIVGLVGVIKSGRKLIAPVSIDGVWNLKVNAGSLAALPCGKAIAEASETALAISQSGKNFTLGLTNGPKSSGTGVLNGTALQASIVPAAEWSAEAGCGNGRQLTLIATVDPKSDPRSLSGSLSVNDCPSCGSVEFRATRQAPPARRGSH